MMHTIRNACMTVTASEKGAELQSILGSDGTEYLWQGDPAYWGDRALNLFPYVARLTQGRYVMDGHTYEMPIHGIAPYARFSIVEKTQERMAFELVSDDRTLAQYPRRFAFRVVYALEGAKLSVRYEVENRDERTMYFGLGGHPGFQVPLDAGAVFEDYRLRFSHTCEPIRVGFSEDCFVNGEDAAFPLEEGCLLPLRHSLFDQDAIVLREMAREITLEAPGCAHAVTVSFPDMPYLGIWHWPKKDAPYVCIEPWRSLPSRKDEIAVLERQKDLVTLEGGRVYVNVFTITIR